MKMKNTVQYSIIDAIFNNYTINNVSDYMYCLYYESKYFKSRDFEVIFDLNFNILYYGYDFSEAYYDPNVMPANNQVLEIYYIRNYLSTNYIFLDSHGKNLNGNKTFTKMMNMDGLISARTSDNKWYTITLSGPEKE